MKNKVYKDLKKRIQFHNNELIRKELLSIRRSEVLRDTPAWSHAVFLLNQLGPAGSLTIIRNLCRITGRSRGILRPYGLSRLEWRRWADKGEIPGIRRASW